MKPTGYDLQSLLRAQRDGLRQAHDATAGLLGLMELVQSQQPGEGVVARLRRRLALPSADDYDFLELQRRQRTWLQSAIDVVDGTLVKVGQAQPAAQKKSPWRQFRRG